MKQPAKIGTFESVAMLIVAGLFDGIQVIANFINLLPGIGQILSFVFNIIATIFAFIIFTVWFFLKKVGLFNPKKPMQLFAKIGMLSSETLPFVSFLPSISITVFMTLAEANGPEHFPLSLFRKIPGPQAKGLNKVVSK